MKNYALAAIASFAFASAGHAATLIDGSTSGYYNDRIGTVLDGTNSYKNSWMFPSANISQGDPELDIPDSEAIDLTAADAALGSWLDNPAAPGGEWSAAPVAIPSTWAVNSETAIIYEIDGGSAGISNVLASFGVDNGVFVWLNGTFLGGHLRPGGVQPGEFQVSLGDFGAGLNYLQILREDHGGQTGYLVEVTGDINMAPVPLPASGMLLGAGALGLAGLRRRQRKS